MSEKLEKRLAGIDCLCGDTALSRIQKMTDNDIRELIHFYDDEDYEPVFSEDKLDPEVEKQLDRYIAKKERSLIDHHIRELLRLKGISGEQEAKARKVIEEAIKDYLR